jgi:ubiquinone biosynthesis protein
VDFKDKFRGLKRFERLCEVLIKYQSLYLIKKELSIWKKNKRTEPQTIRLILEEMGGGFVKLAQLLSIRPDLIPHEYCLELSKLQDSVKPFPFNDAKKIIETSSGKKLKTLFSQFNSTPIASASVGQVYKAKLKSGETVAVKVRRPEIEKTFKQDIALMEFVAGLVKNIHGVDIIDPEEIVISFKEYTNNELNYLEEGKNIQLFYENLKNTGVKIPKLYPELSSKDVLVMEFIEGHELKYIFDKKGIKEFKTKIAKDIFNVFLKQVMIDGVFHADPHPSNILLLPGKKEKIALLDFGIIGKLTPMLRAEIVKLFIALNEKDMEGIITAMMHMNMVSKDDEEIRKDMRNMLGPYYGAGLNKIDFPKLFMQSIKVARKHKLKVSKDYVLLGKAVLTIESVCVELYPEFNFVEESKHFITRLTLHEYSPSKFISRGFLKLETARKLALEIPAVISNLFNKSGTDDAHNKRIEELSEHLIRSEHRIDVLVEKMIFMFTTLILIVAGFLLINKEPVFDGLSIFSIVLFSMAAATFLIAVFLNAKK